MADLDRTHEPMVRCPNPDPHEPHQYAVRAGGITYAGGLCDPARWPRTQPTDAGRAERIAAACIRCHRCAGCHAPNGGCPPAGSTCAVGRCPNRYDYETALDAVEKERDALKRRVVKVESLLDHLSAHPNSSGLALIADVRAALGSSHG